VLVTSDLKLVEEVFIKQSHNFSARIDIIDFLSDDTVLTAEKGKWKRLRSIMNPTFSSAKLKDMVPVMGKCVDRLTSKIALNTNVDLKLSDLLNRFTMDTIWNCAFGIDINPQEDVNNPYFKRSQEAFVIPVDFGFVFFITSMFVMILIS
jgi:thromboxane-A synthase